jgi:hypothetical protein
MDQALGRGDGIIGNESIAWPLLQCRTELLHGLWAQSAPRAAIEMTRATVFLIVGLGFLAFAGLSIYQGGYIVGRSGGVVIARAHDPEVFWRGIVIQVIIGCALLYLGRLARLGRSARPSAGDLARGADPGEERPKLPNYDPEFCGRVLKAAACVCVGWTIAELLVLFMVHPNEARCPGWVFYPHQRSAASLWLLAGMLTVLPTAWISNIALRWNDTYARKMYDSIADGPPGQSLIDLNWLMLIVIAGWCLFSAIPLFLMLDQCTVLHQYFAAVRLS